MGHRVRKRWTVRKVQEIKGYKAGAPYSTVCNPWDVILFSLFGYR